MRKALAVILVIVMVLGVMPIAVFASEYGPLPMNGDEIQAFAALYIRPDNTDDEPEFIYFFDGQNACNYTGASYDLETNTLTLNGLETELPLAIVNMGEDFVINVTGENTVGPMTVNGTDVEGHDARVTFTGDGVLTVNRNRHADYAIYMENEPAGGTARLTVGEDVTLNLYGLVGAAYASHVSNDDVFCFEGDVSSSVEKKNAVEINDSIRGFRLEDCDERFLGFLADSKNGEEGQFVYNEIVENGETVGYRVNRFYSVYVNSKAYYIFDREFNEEVLGTDEFYENYTPEQAESIGGYRQLTNRTGNCTFYASAPVYESPFGEELVVINVFNPDTNTNEDIICSISSIPEMTNKKYFSVKTGDIEISDLTSLNKNYAGYYIDEAHSNGPESLGNLCFNVPRPNEVEYAAKRFTNEIGEFEYWSVKKYVYSAEYDYYFQDFNFTDTTNPGEHRYYSEEDFNKTNYSNFTWSIITANVALMSKNYDDGFECKTYTDGDGKIYGVDEMRLEQEGIADIYDAIEIDGCKDFDGTQLYAFVKNGEIDISDLTKQVETVELGNVFDVTLKGKSFSTDGFEAWVKLADNEGNEYTPEDVIELKVGEKRFFYCLTDYDNNADHGITPYVGFSENDEHIWTLTPAGFKITGGTGEELGFEGIYDFGILVDTTGMPVTTEAPLYCWLYEFDGKVPGQEGFDWNSLTTLYTFEFKFAVSPSDGWNHFADGHWEFISEGVNATGWKKLNNKWYYFNTDGVMQTGWQKINSKWYYFGGANDGVMKTGWQKLNSKWYYFGGANDGVMKTGWQKVNSKWYYFGGADDGVMKTGWQKINSKWYYFGGTDDGVMKTGWQKISNKWYYFNADGDMKTGWLKSGGNWYYLDSNGAMLANTSRKIGNKTYKFNASGICTNP